MHPSLTDLLTILYRPRETMRRILDGGRNRWTSEVVALACICTSVSDPDINRIRGLSLGSTLALVALALLVTAIAWVLLLYAFAWLAMQAGRRLLAGEGTYRDVRAALGWGLVPLIWSVLYRIPAGVYLARIVVIQPGQDERVLFDFLEKGGCSFAVLLFAIQLVLWVWVVYVMSCTVGEALRFSSLKGLGTLAIAAAAPVVICVAAVMVSRS